MSSSSSDSYDSQSDSDDAGSRTNKLILAPSMLEDMKYDDFDRSMDEVFRVPPKTNQQNKEIGQENPNRNYDDFSTLFADPKERKSPRLPADTLNPKRTDRNETMEEDRDEILYQKRKSQLKEEREKRKIQKENARKQLEKKGRKQLKSIYDDEDYDFTSDEEHKIALSTKKLEKVKNEFKNLYSGEKKKGREGEKSSKLVLPVERNPVVVNIPPAPSEKPVKPPIAVNQKNTAIERNADFYRGPDVIATSKPDFDSTIYMFADKQKLKPNFKELLKQNDTQRSLGALEVDERSFVSQKSVGNHMEGRSRTSATNQNNNNVFGSIKNPLGEQNENNSYFQKTPTITLSKLKLEDLAAKETEGAPLLERSFSAKSVENPNFSYVPSRKPTRIDNASPFPKKLNKEGPTSTIDEDNLERIIHESIQSYMKKKKNKSKNNGRDGESSSTSLSSTSDSDSSESIRRRQRRKIKQTQFPDVSSSSEDDRKNKRTKAKKKKGEELRKAIADENFREKKVMLYEFYKMEQRGVFCGKKYTLDDDIDEMRFDYHRMKSEADVKDKVTTVWNAFAAINSSIELLNQKYNPFNVNMNGWTEHVDKDKEKYEPQFRKLYKTIRFRFTLNPGTQIALMYASQFLVFIVPRILGDRDSQNSSRKNTGNGEETKNRNEEELRRTEEIQKMMEELNKKKKELKLQSKKIIMQHKIIQDQNERIQQLKTDNTSDTSTNTKNGSAVNSPRDTAPKAESVATTEDRQSESCTHKDGQFSSTERNAPTDHPSPSVSRSQPLYPFISKEVTSPYYKDSVIVSSNSHPESPKITEIVEGDNSVASVCVSPIVLDDGSGYDSAVGDYSRPDSSTLVREIAVPSDIRENLFLPLINTMKRAKQNTAQSKTAIPKEFQMYEEQIPNPELRDTLISPKPIEENQIVKVSKQKKLVGLNLDETVN